VRVRQSVIRNFRANPGSMTKPVRPLRRKPTVSIIGAGRLGTALALGLFSSGYAIQAVVTRRRQTARKAAALIGPNTLPLTAGELDRLPASRILLVTTPDDEIPRVAQSLIGAEKASTSQRIVLHTSGALSAGVLQPLAKIGFHVGSLHPLVSVSHSEMGKNNLRGAFYSIEGQPAATKVARAIVRDLGGRSFTISSHNKALYHAAAVMSSGHVLALYEIATEMLVECGLARRDARRVLLPLLQSTVINLARSETARALTGTFARGDIATVQRHLQSLSRNGLEQAQEVYKILGVRSLELAVAKGLDPKLAKRIKKELARSTGRSTR
jgi:predicted short-subunit dehydrogenase-like oxidoreductase (DUF2520 family)